MTVMAVGLEERTSVHHGSHPETVISRCLIWASVGALVYESLFIAGCTNLSIVFKANVGKTPFQLPGLNSATPLINLLPLCFTKLYKLCFWWPNV